jgi:hypothetical protein
MHCSLVQWFKSGSNCSTFSFAQGKIRPRMVDRDSVESQRRRGPHTREKIQSRRTAALLFLP